MIALQKGALQMHLPTASAFQMPMNGAIKKLRILFGIVLTF